MTPFRGDFIDYVECRIPVNDIKETNMVIGMGTTLHKFEIAGKPIYFFAITTATSGFVPRSGVY